MKNGLPKMKDFPSELGGSGESLPENTLKFGVGVMLSAFGVFWTGEGLGVDWPGHDLALFVFAALFLVAGLMAANIVRQPIKEVTP